MPHLSPMNWLTMILLIWLATLTIMSILWWNTSTKWPNILNSTKTSSSANWKWNL